MKNVKKYLILLTSICCLLLAMTGIINYRVDPFYIYHGNGKHPEVFYSEVHQNLGMAEHFDYDALITGSSMTENFKPSVFDAAFGCNSLKLPFAGGYMDEYLKLMNKALNREQRTQYVFFGLDLYALESNPYENHYPFDRYQTSGNPLVKIEYLLNGEVLFHYSMNNLLEEDELRKAKHPRDTAYAWDSYNTYSKEVVLSSAERPEDHSRTGINEEMVNHSEVNLSLLEHIIQENPDTEFYVFYPPYSILYWDNSIRNGNYDSEMEILKKTSENLLGYSNVHLFAFITDTKLITDLDNYKDYSHYSGKVNDEMIKWMKEGRKQLTKESYESVLNEFEIFTRNHDYDAVFQ